MATQEAFLFSGSVADNEDGPPQALPAEDDEFARLPRGVAASPA